MKKYDPQASAERLLPLGFPRLSISLPGLVKFVGQQMIASAEELEAVNPPKEAEASKEPEAEQITKEAETQEPKEEQPVSNHKENLEEKEPSSSV